MSAFKVVILDEYRASGAERTGPGRPPKYSEPTKCVSFRVPLSLKTEGARKARAERVNMTELFAYHYLHFLRQSAEATRRQLEAYRALYGPIE